MSGKEGVYSWTEEVGIFLNHIKSCPNYTFECFNIPDKTKSQFGTSQEIEMMIDYLESQDYVSVIKYENDVKVAVKLKYKGLYWKEFEQRSDFDYIKEKWVIILSLIISVISFIRTL